MVSFDFQFKKYLITEFAESSASILSNSVALTAHLYIRCFYTVHPLMIWMMDWLFEDLGMVKRLISLVGRLAVGGLRDHLGGISFLFQYKLTLDSCFILLGLCQLGNI